MDAKKQATLARLQESISSIEQQSLSYKKASKSKSKTSGSFSCECEKLPLSFSEDFLAEDDSDKAFKKISDLVRVRDRSVHEVIKRLTELEFSEQGIEIAIQKALRCNYLNDERFASIYIRSKINQGKGSAGIKVELLSHNISEHVIEDAFSEYVLEDDEEERALNYLRRKPSRSKNPFQSSYAKLVRRGFSSSIALSATKKWISEQVH